MNRRNLYLLCALLLLILLAAGTRLNRGRSAVAPNRWRDPAILADGRIDANRADAQLLATLPGIGEALAQRIAEDREINGLFRSASDLTRVNGIGEGKLQGIRDRIALPAP